MKKISDKKIKSLLICVVVIFTAFFIVSCGDEMIFPRESDAEKVITTNAVYLGIKNYGQEEVNKDNKDSFQYMFEIDGKESTFRMDNGTVNEDGAYDYPIQNILKEGYSYLVGISGNTIISAEETGDEKVSYVPKVQGTPGKRTLLNFLKTAMMPVGTTLYIYGGGWDWQDVGSAIQTRTIGVSPDWVKFFDEHDEDFTYKSKDGNEDNSDPSTSYYPYGGYNEYYYAGLDCSGFLGWILYNTFETENGGDGYVGGSTGIAKRLSKMGFGEWTQNVKAPDGKNGYEMKPGDVMSINGHVWISLGTCDDGSVVIVHSTPANSRTGQPGGGVEISAIGTTEKCEAYILADHYMSEYYPKWYERYPVKLAEPEVYFTFEGENAGRFTWNTENTTDGITDPERVSEKSPEDVLKMLFAE